MASGGVFETMEAVTGEVDVDDFEQVAFGHHGPSGLRAIIAVHSTALGPALGGTRFWPYASETAALVDACRLARGMTYKHAAAGLGQGGGKAVIWGDPAALRSEALLRAYGRFVHGLAGRYVTAEDVGTTQADMDLIRTETPHVTGASPALGGSGDPSPATAWGVLWAMRAAAGHRWGEASLEGRHVVVSGVGKVGSALVGHLLDDGAAVTVTDIVDAAVRAVLDHHPEAVAAGRLRTVEPDQAHAVACDVFAPCALGAVLDGRTIAELRCEVIAGSANNQLAGPCDDHRLAARDVLYVPDYVANAGGVINIAEERGGYDRDRAWARVARIHDTVLAVLDRARTEGIPPGEAADRHAEARLAAAAVDGTHGLPEPAG